VATSVGMAIASRWLAATYNRPGHDLFGFNVYALAGDGCMMEGVASEAASLAAHLQLSNLCWIYDNNKITIEGATDIAFTEDVATRFVGYGWNVTRVGDANDLQMLGRAFATFAREQHRPTLIIVDSHIAYGAPTKEGTAAAHGEPLGEDEVRATKSFYGFPPDEQFYVPDGVYENFADGIGARGARLSGEWKAAFEAYRAEFPDLADQLDRMQRRELPDGWDADIPTFPADPKGIASRASSGQVLNALAKNYPWLIGGAADLAPSTKTTLTFAGSLQADTPGGRNLHFGVREFASGAVTNGLALSKIRAYWSGFMIFSDFARGAIRLSSIMEIPTINIFTHDSIGVGEDGPTHQPVEQLPSLRAIPGLLVIRPSDANEVAEAWRFIARLKHEPVALVLSRQNLPTLDRSVYAPASGLAQGAYVLASADDPELILMATGSEVSLVVGAYEQLVAEGVRARVVSMPCLEVFEQQPQSYRDEVLPPSVRARVAVEQASTLGWHRYVGFDGAVIGMETFGASAPLKELLTKFGFTPDRVLETARTVLARAKG
jgi:transketolase